jgi:plasmid stability protein
MTKEESKKIISVEIPESLRKALKIEAFNQDKTVSALIRDILEKELKVQPKK